MDISKKKPKKLKDIIKSINKNIAISFLIILIFLIVIAGTVFIDYKKYEEKIISQKITATFSAFNTKTSQKLIAITSRDDFIHYLHSGWISRELRYAPLLAIILYTNLKAIVGMDIYDSNEENIFSYGVKTNYSITLDLCYLNRRSLNFDVGTCSHNWKLYFNKEDIIKELKMLNPELIDCYNCNNSLVINQTFGDFPASKFTNMNIGLTIKKSPTTILWGILFFITIALSVIVIWNINRIKRVFKEYLYHPIVEITAKINQHDRLPNIVVEELSCLSQQIDQWKKKVIELEKLKAQEKANEEKIKIMQSIGASIAHELRTPIRSMISGVIGIEKFLPVLLENYDLARKNNLPAKVIKPQQIELLRKVLNNLKSEGAAANTIIDMLLMKIKGSITEATSIKKLSIKECLHEALQRYSFQESEGNLIVCDTTNDFQFEGDEILIVHVLFNLLKNALYYIASAQKGQIYIRFEYGKNENLLYFRDTGKGISKEVLPRIFNRFYSKTEGGVGIGLSFCKMAMEWMSGDITCQSVEGEYAEFVLHFPIDREKSKE